MLNIHSLKLFNYFTIHTLPESCLPIPCVEGRIRGKVSQQEDQKKSATQMETINQRQLAAQSGNVDAQGKYSHLIMIS